MAAITKLMQIDQGTSHTEFFVIEEAPNVPMALTGYTAQMQAREAYDATSALVSLSTGAGIEIDELNGKVTINITPEQTSKLRFLGGKLKGVYDLEITSPAGDVTRIVQGLFIVNREVTR